MVLTDHVVFGRESSEIIHDSCCRNQLKDPNFSAAGGARQFKEHIIHKNRTKFACHDCDYVSQQLFP